MQNQIIRFFFIVLILFVFSNLYGVKRNWLDQKIEKSGLSVKKNQEQDWLNELKTALDNGTINDINQQTTGASHEHGVGQTMLMSALEDSKYEIAQYLIDQGCNVNLADKEGKTPLHTVVEKLWYENNDSKIKQLTDLLKQLLLKNANIRAEDNWNRTPISYGLEKDKDKKGIPAALRIFVEHDPSLVNETMSVNINPKKKNTLLFWAVDNCDKELCEMLINKGAHVDLQGLEGQTPLNAAIKNARASYKEGKKNLNDTIFSLLMNNNADVNAKGKDDETPLLVTMEQLGSIKDSDENDILQTKKMLIILDLLIEKGANLSTKSKVGRTPIYYGIRHGKLSGLKKIIDSAQKNDPVINDPITVDWSVINNYQTTLMHWAAENGYFDLCQTLINKGANVNARGKFGATPLHAVMFELTLNQDDDKINQLIQIITLLIKNGADASLKNTGNYEETPFGEVVDKLSNKNVQAGILALIEALPNNDPAINVPVKKDNSMTLLHYATKIGDFNLCHKLLIKEADVNAKEKYNETPLHMIIEKLSSENDDSKIQSISKILALLLSFGADATIENKSGKSPISYAFESTKKGSISSLEIIIKAAKKDSKVINALFKYETKGFFSSAVKQKTLLHWAAEHGNKVLCQALLDKGANVFAQDNSNNKPADVAKDNEIKNFLHQIQQQEEEKIKQEEQMKRVEEERVREEAERLKQEEAERKAREEAERLAREKEETERLAREEAERLKQEEAERKAREEAEEELKKQKQQQEAGAPLAQRLETLKENLGKLKKKLGDLSQVLLNLKDKLEKKHLS